MTLPNVLGTATLQLGHRTLGGCLGEKCPMDVLGAIGAGSADEHLLPALFPLEYRTWTDPKLAADLCWDRDLSLSGQA
jgi:hypothetical protein